MAIDAYNFVEAEKKSNPRPVTVEEFPALIERRSEFPKPHFVYLASDISPEHGRPWCPDVVRSLPAVRRQVAKAGGTLFQINVGPRPVWKDPNHPLRHSLQATGVPTLINWTEGGAGKRLGQDLEHAGRGLDNGEEIVEKKVADFIQSINE